MSKSGLLPLLLLSLCAQLILILAGCGKDAHGDVLGEAYVAPATLNLRRELSQKNTAAGVLKHGDKVDVIDVRRRFVKVRTPKGEEGWVDSLQLLSPAQMSQISSDQQRAAKLPPEGAAGVFEALNIHIDPNRQSPAFARIPEGGSVTVLAHRVEPKMSTPLRPPNLLAERPQPLSRRQKKQLQTRATSRLPSPPPPPKPPPNWQELSIGHPTELANSADPKADKEKGAAAQKALDPKKPLILEDWSLVRTKDNQCGWVLSRNLVMSIPDEVAQYAEGRRISSYFDLGAVQDDEKGVKHNWLWTTSSTVASYDFDAWRVFLWNRHKHRYETSYRQRDLEGYFPVHVDPVDTAAFGRTFQLITKDDDGKFRKRAYIFDGTRVHLTGTADYRPGESDHIQTTTGLNTAGLEVTAHKEGWLRRQWSSLLARLSAKH